MKNICLVIALSLLSLYMMAQEAATNIIPGEFMVQLQGNIKADVFFQSYPQLRVTECLSQRMNIWLITSSSPGLLGMLKENPNVIAVQYNHDNVARRSIVPNDTFFSSQWNMQNLSHPGADISGPQAWQVNHSAVTQTGDTIVIAVIDGTFDIYHEDLHFFVNKNEIPHNGIDDDGNGYIDDYHGWNVFMNNDSVYDLLDDHGTHVAGIAAAITDNAKGVAGVCWGAKVLAIDGSSTRESDVIKAYDYVIAMRSLYDQTSGARGAFIVATNSSFGIDKADPAGYPIWCALYDSMGHYGILSACATANNNFDVDAVGDMPTTCPSKWMIAVTNTTSTDARNTSAGYGPVNIDIGAPGTIIRSTFPGNNYDYNTGTSMATPHISGAIAAMMANACPRFMQDYFAYPDSMSLVLRDYMYHSVDPLASLAHITATGGRLNLYQAYITQSSYNCNNCNYNIRLTQQNITCYGDSAATVTAYADTASGGYHYLWSTGDTVWQKVNLKAGFYQLTVTDSAGCQRSASAIVTQPAPLHITHITIIPLTAANPANVVITATSGTDTLIYAVDSGAFQSGNILIVDSPGLHHFRVRNANGCELDTVLAIRPSGIRGEQYISYISLAPNPASSTAELIIRSDQNFSAHLLLADITGRSVQQDPVEISTGILRKSIDLSSLSEGIYILSVISEGRALTSIKISVIR